MNVCATKTYVPLKGNRSNVGQTAWALMALILAGQVFSSRDKLRVHFIVSISTPMVYYCIQSKCFSILFLNFVYRLREIQLPFIVLQSYSLILS